MDNSTRIEKLLKLINHPNTPEYERLLAVKIFDKLTKPSTKQRAMHKAYTRSKNEKTSSINFTALYIKSLF